MDANKVITMIIFYRRNSTELEISYDALQKVTKYELMKSIIFYQVEWLIDNRVHIGFISEKTYHRHRFVLQDKLSTLVIFRQPEYHYRSESLPFFLAKYKSKETQLFLDDKENEVIFIEPSTRICSYLDQDSFLSYWLITNQRQKRKLSEQEKNKIIRNSSVFYDDYYQKNSILVFYQHTWRRIYRPQITPISLEKIDYRNKSFYIIWWENHHHQLFHGILYDKEIQKLKLTVQHRKKPSKTFQYDCIPFFAKKKGSWVQKKECIVLQGHYFTPEDIIALKRYKNNTIGIYIYYVTFLSEHGENNPTLFIAYDEYRWLSSIRQMMNDSLH